MSEEEVGWHNADRKGYPKRPDGVQFAATSPS